MIKTLPILIDKYPPTNRQIHFNIMSEWYNSCQIKPKQNKSVLTTFTLYHYCCSNISFHFSIILSDTIRYLGLIMKLKKFKQFPVKYNK